MAREEYDEPMLLDEEEFDVPEDNAKALTSGLVITTFAVLLLAIIVVVAACGKWYDIGPFADKAA